MTPEFLRRGYSVTVLDNFMYSQNSLAECCCDDNFSIVRGDCRDEATLKPLVKSHDIVIPLAALVGAPLCNRDRVGAETINSGAIKTLTGLMSKDQRLVIPITNSGYGIGEQGKFCTEETPMRPISLYGKTKVDAEDTAMSRENSISLRLATVFGMSPRMRLDLLVNDFTYRAVKDRFLVVFEGHFKRNYVHIRDVVRAFLHAIEKFDKMKSQAYNVGLSEANMSKLELCAKIREYVKDFVVLEAPCGEDPDKRDYIVSNDKIEKTGYKTEFSLDMGIRELLKGYTIINNNKYSNV
jgi:nucleoside-diphosphate-sugar epimerase